MDLNKFYKHVRLIKDLIFFFYYYYSGSEQTVISYKSSFIASSPCVSLFATSRSPPGFPVSSFYVKVQWWEKQKPGKSFLCHQNCVQYKFHHKRDSLHLRLALVTWSHLAFPAKEGTQLQQLWLNLKQGFFIKTLPC